MCTKLDEHRTIILPSESITTGMEGYKILNFNVESLKV
jgi:hypothetical protein